jgi:hypothetical protein
MRLNWFLKDGSFDKHYYYINISNRLWTQVVATSGINFGDLHNNPYLLGKIGKK